MKREQKRVEINDVIAIHNHGLWYRDGLHGFPQDYTPFLDLEWLIEVPLEQNIFIDFISFDVEFAYQCWYILPQKQLLSIPKYE